ncbi:rootletin-like, partial [Chiloscyllium plagiosum]|uniref:rootletin-like n=1 Tax=Chiloscyllium plagiosum TaxID=36176 RepID=UPI001CB87E54
MSTSAMTEGRPGPLDGRHGNSEALRAGPALKHERSEPSVGKEVEEAEEEEEGEAVQDPSRNLRRRLSEERAAYRRKLQAYREGQERQAVLVQKLQGK